MKRKVVRHGSNTLTVSIPAKWAKSNRISAGDEIEVLDKKNFLTISSQMKETHEKTVIDTRKMNKRVAETSLTGAYSRGYDEVEIIYDSKELMDYLIVVMHTALLGYEVFYQSDKRCIIKGISETQSSHFDSIMRKNFQILDLLAEESLRLIKAKKFNELTSLFVLERTNNKFTNYLHRVLSRNGAGQKDDFFLYAIILLLERVGDIYREICECLPDVPAKDLKLGELAVSGILDKESGPVILRKETFDIYSRTNEMLKKYEHYFYSFDMALANEIESSWKNILFNAQKMSKSSNNSGEIKVLSELAILANTFDMLLTQTISLSIK
jgi:phosphate uptake regulator